ncbi:MAG: BrnA antitoxin family protein [Alphaproteobacteria bacterium]|nr:BrnA antitoxin family protein [Alphaproteobacteria bacterium]
MSEKNITSMSLSEALLRRGEDRTDWDRLRREEAAGIEPEADPDEGEFDESTARFVEPRRKQAISVRLDPDILEFFKADGPGYQTRMNAALRLYMNSCRERARAKEAAS